MSLFHNCFSQFPNQFVVFLGLAVVLLALIGTTRAIPYPDPLADPDPVADPDPEAAATCQTGVQSCWLRKNLHG